jgi:hypothetical protein
MKILKSCLIGLAGFILGAWLFHTPSTGAASVGTVYVTEVPDGPVGQVIMGGSEIVGFSCVPSRGDVACYVATR